MYTFLPGDIVEMRGRGTIFGERFEVVQHFRQQDAGHNANTWAGAMRDYFLNEFCAAATSQMKFTSVLTRRVIPVPFTREEEVAIAPIQGGWSGETMPHQIATIFKTITALDAPAGRGRIYIPGMPQSWYVGGNFSGAAMATMSSICARLHEWSHTGGYSFARWVVLSRQASPGAANDVHEIRFSGQPCTMRSRRPNVY